MCECVSVWYGVVGVGVDDRMRDGVLEGGTGEDSLLSDQQKLLRMIVDRLFCVCKLSVK